jgi:serine/threonine protein phosphatase PrpC
MTESAPAAPPSRALGNDQPTCPTCGATVSPTASFCEVCGTSLTPIDGVADDYARGEELESPITLSRPVERDEAPVAGLEAALETDVGDDTEDTVIIARPCANCGGVIGEDGYCQTCGTKAPTERDHYTEQPSSWVAACCDKGIRHFRNEDATAVASDPALGGRAVLVVCDGVSTSVDSDVASLAAARTAREVLLAHRPAGMGVPASQAAATAAALQAAAAKANAAVVEKTAPGSDNAASCTFAAAVIDGSQIVFGNVGDSRVYWVPDPGSATQPVELSVDDSVAQARIAMGVSREEAENGPQAHAITKWLGRDSPDFSPRTGSIDVTDPGWLVVCSDGLWNYVSEAAALQSLIGTLRGAEPDPLPLSVALVGWANQQGGKDNISVALARHEA